MGAGLRQGVLWAALIVSACSPFAADNKADAADNKADAADDGAHTAASGEGGTGPVRVGMPCLSSSVNDSFERDGLMGAGWNAPTDETTLSISGDHASDGVKSLKVVRGDTKVKALLLRPLTTSCVEVHLALLASTPPPVGTWVTVARIVAQDPDGGTIPLWTSAELRNDGGLRLRVSQSLGGDSYVSLSGDELLAADDWNDIVIRYDPTGVRLFLNGAERNMKKTGYPSSDPTGLEIGTDGPPSTPATYFIDAVTAL